MSDAWNRLRDAFVKDHQTLTHGYRGLLQAIASREFVSASELALRLDKRAGAHIEFEERFLYPKIEVSHGDAYTARLYDEHDEVVEALVELQNLTPESTPSEEKIADWTERLHMGLEHATACESLLRHLQSESAHTQKAYLSSLNRLREQGCRWSQLRPMDSKS